ncbi:ABC transporter ATP-binding protein [Paenibacillus typhae]|uniref:Teichoic acid transport system ATP-binding protein n=1 Tax=Paenibacillus typhae TaxID=1174501 RepID=A0A1G8NK17_9BACL|nr:ABC transporter ATP-binding protein [Paenibacillus typhae]SDI80505.1 teichoic acid transport system ATP-binding protein [Paenibacillus typhae]
MGQMNAIEVKDLTKIYKLYNKQTDRLKETLSLSKKKYHKDFKALNRISFNVKTGECLGIIGKNGSGKSTLLKILTGVLTPTSGAIDVTGKISALLELGAGFNPDLTGMENIYLNGTIMGYSHSEMSEKVDGILAFADIGEFIHQPVKSYSSGMFVRLAFAVAINVEPDILIIDEALSVGDLRFQQKCYRKIDELKKTKTVLFVTHDLSVINKYCDRVLWINEGILLEDGDPKMISKKYQAFMIGADFKKINFKEQVEAAGSVVPGIEDEIDSLNDELDVMGDDKAMITGISLLDSITGEKTSVVEGNQELRLLLKIDVLQKLEDPIVGFSIKDRLGTIISQTNSYVLGSDLATLHPNKNNVFSFDFRFPNLNHGQYTISPAIASGTQEDHRQHSWVHDALVLQVLPLGYEELSGIVHLSDVIFSSLK